MRKPRRVTTACALALALLTGACNSFVRNMGEETVTPVSIDPQIAGDVKVGGVVFMAGYELTYGARFFGGLSGLVVSDDGSRMVAVSDLGHWVTANLSQDASGRLTGVSGIELLTLPGVGGDSISTVLQPGERDAEALAVLPDGRAIVSFERRHRIWVYDKPGSQNAPLELETPATLVRLQANNGLEAIDALPDGRLLTIAAAPVGTGTIIDMWLLDQKGRWHSMGYVMKDGFKVADMTALPDGRVIVLEHWYAAPGAIRIRLREITPAMLDGGGLVDGKVIAEFDPPLLIDDFQGIDSRTGPNGETLLYLVSDDNFDPLQQTLLYQFRLAP